MWRWLVLLAIGCPVALVNDLKLKIEKVNRLEERQAILKSEMCALEFHTLNKEGKISVHVLAQTWLFRLMLKSKCLSI